MHEPSKNSSRKNVIIFAIFINNKNDENGVFSLLEKRWIEKNKSKIVDVAVLNDVPIFGEEGEGVFFDFLNDFSKETNIQFNMTCISQGNYCIKFYKYGELDSNLPVFDMFATLNRGTDNEMEVVFDVVDGIGNFTFDASRFNVSDNIIEISVGSLINSISRVFKVTYSYDVPEYEIPT